ncbi:MAG: GNAT family N-acetyltransferase [Leptospirales bacterium]|jgi:predicted GNAT family acetyltransferase
MTTIEHSQSATKGVFYALDQEQDGERIGEMTYSRAGETLIIIDHTEAYRGHEGQGVGRELVAAGVAHARENDLKILPLCPYALAQFKRHAEYADVWKQPGA